MLDSLPTKGVLTTSDGDAELDNAYGINALTYTSNEDECASSYSDSFTFYVIDENDA